MSSQSIMSGMCVAEFALWAVFGCLFWRRRLQLQFPAMGVYLCLRLAAMPILLYFYYGQGRNWFNGYCYDFYFYSYWLVYFASAVILCFICIEIFRSALSSFPGLQRLGTVAFRWVALVSVVLSLPTIPLEHSWMLMMTHTAFRLMRSVSILELCLLAFLCLSLNALGLSMREIPFGLALGLGIISSGDFLTSLLWSRSASTTDLYQFVTESLILLSLSIWIVYSALPEPARKSVVLPAHSIILRWNEIASALGHTGTQVAVQPSGGFVLTDVEKTIETVLNRKLKNRESET